MVSYNIIEFARSAKLVKSIPEEKSFIEWALRETQKNVLPFLLLIDAVGFEFLPLVIKIIMVFVIIFLPLWILFGLFWIFDNQKEDVNSEYIVPMEVVNENEDDEDVENLNKSSPHYIQENYPYKRTRDTSNKYSKTHNCH
eukprot:TRINITY_DN4519_c0_g2_i1.p1 TRINITY_DN4519_c0_g2~~TRINITY_DN4519_c0_g2_i1.p1  ORF type:complete len:141 (+),score=17.18 TRINITY_DN4519_c0_g2_i1:454-876(+)